MSEELTSALERFERVMGTRFPEWFEQLQPGLDDEGIERLRQGVAPLLLPAQVEQLYRWRSGGDGGVFGGWRLRTADELLRWYRFCVDELDEPPAWLPAFDDQMVSIVTLDVPGAEPSDRSVWYGHTHDIWVDRMFDSVAHLVETVCDAAEAGAITVDDTLIGIRDEHGYLEHVHEAAWVGWRQARCPGAYRWPDPPAGSHLERFPQPDWPAVWLASLGVDDAAPQSAGPTHTIAQLVAEAATRPVSGTIRGRVVNGTGRGRLWLPEVDDGTGRLVVVCDPRVVPLGAPLGSEAEFDVVLESADVPAPVVDDDPRVVALAERFRPALPTAVAVAVRPASSH